MKRVFLSLVCLLLISGCTVFSPLTPAAATPATAITETSAPEPTAAPETPAAPQVTEATIPTVPVVTAAPAETTATGDGPALTLEMLANFTYALDHTPDGLIPLQDGQYFIDQAEPPLRVASEMVGAPAFGDLNGDGLQDAAVLLRTNTGGTGTFYDLIPVFNQGGVPVQGGFAYVGDRQAIKDLRVENGRIIVDHLTQGPNDGACCPSQHVLRTYQVVDNRLMLASEQLLVSADEIATPVPVLIFIDQPSQSDFVVSPLHVSGRIEPMPSQGFVEFALTDYFDNILLNSGQIPVQSQGGTGGTFSADIEFDRAATTTTILRLEIFYSENALLYGRSVVEVLLPQ